jgi:hypothetical protein
LPPDQPVGTYLEAARSFADLVASLPAPLAGSGLGDWDLRALVGHTSRSLVTVIEYLAQPPVPLDVESGPAYVIAAGRTVASAGAGVTERGVTAGAALGDDPAGHVRALLDQVTSALAGVDLERVVPTFAGGMRVRDYLPTRTFELVVHGLDIAAAVPVRWTPPGAALRSAVALAGGVAVLRGEGSLLLRLVTGREPGGISIV